MIRGLFALLTLFIWISISLLEIKTLKDDKHKIRFLVFQTLTCLAVLGFFLSESLVISFMFFEVMSFTSAVLVFHEQSKTAIRAGASYLAYAVIGGMASLMGLFLYYSNDEHSLLAAILMLVGFAAKSGMLPVHTWLVRSYTAAPYPATILLSSLLSKCGIFGIMTICGFVIPHDETFGKILVVFGVLTIFAGGIRGILECDLKRILACSSMSQMGFIIVGLGAFCALGKEGLLAIAGVVIYSINHAIIKLILFGVAAGSFTMLTLKKNKVMLVVMVMAMLSVSGLPGLNGYVGKTLVHEGLLECGPGIFKICEILFIIGGGLTTCYMLRIFELFVYSGIKEDGEFELPTAFKGVLVFSAVIMVVIGVYPPAIEMILHESQMFFGLEHLHHELHLFSLEALMGAAKSIGIGVILFVLVRKRSYEDVLAGKKDLEDLFFKPLLFDVLPVLCTDAARLISLLPEWFLAFLRGIIFFNRPKVFSPNLNENFGNYVQDAKPSRIPRGISYSLLLFVGGITVALLYLMVSYFVHYGI